MKHELGFEKELPGQPEESGPDCKSEDPVSHQPVEARADSNGLNVMDTCYVPRIRPCEPNGVSVYSRNKMLKTDENWNECSVGASDRLQGCLGILSKADGTENLNDGVLVLDRNEGNLDGGEAVNDGRLEGVLELEGVEGGDSKMMEIEAKGDPAVVLVKGDASRRFTPSTLKMKSENSEIENGNSEELRDTVVLEAERLEDGDMSALGTPTRTTEMKKSKKVEIQRLPTTVKELFETRLLEGYPVLYNGGKRGFPLRGTIKESGILCSCSLCKGSRVIPPCQFEIHACKSYRRASQYICLENGKSLLDVVKECRKASLKTLEETIQNFIGPLPVKESIVCQNCTRLFLATSPGKVDQLCDLCTCVTQSEADATCADSRPLESVPGLTLLETGGMHNIPEISGHRGRKKRKHLELRSNGTSPGRSSLRKSSRNKSQCITEKSSRSASGSSLVNLSKSTSVPIATGSGSLHSSMKHRSRNKILKKSSNFPAVSKSSKSASSSLSAKKCSWKITKKDQSMHKIVFEDGGLPDGTEVAYYSHGKKLRDGYKMGSGILCRCCNILMSPCQFEVHAGWASRKKPYMYIYTSNGVSLHEFAISLLKGRECSAKDSDDLCIICADGGNLVLCDGCPRAFHKECASLSSIPQGKWYCTYCQNTFQENGHESHDDQPPVSLKRKKTRDGEARQPTVEEAPQLLDDLVEVVPSPDVRGSPSHVAPEREGSPLPDFRFPPSQGYSEMRAVKSLVTPRSVQSIACRSVDDIERVLSVHTQRAVTLQIGLAESSRRLASELKELKNVVEEKKKEAHHYKKKLSSLRKSVEDLESRSMEREYEIDNLRSVLARAPKEAVVKYRASVEYAKDLETSVERYKLSTDFDKALNSYGEKVMTASIKLTKEWICVEHPSIDPTSFDRFLAKRKDKEGGAPPI